MTVALGFTFYRNVPAVCAMNHVAFGATSGAKFLSFSVNMYIDDARNRIVLNVQDAKRTTHPDLTHLLFIDQDMLPPKDTLHRLLAWDTAVVSALYFDRIDQNPVAYNSTDLEPLPHEMFGPEGLTQVACVGMGATLIDLRVFDMLDEHFGKGPWFSSSGRKGEDVYFCERIAALGITPFVDGSLVVPHVADYPIVGPKHEGEHLWEKPTAEGRFPRE